MLAIYVQTNYFEHGVQRLSTFCAGHPRVAVFASRGAHPNPQFHRSITMAAVQDVETRRGEVAE
jgi:hypothetical protein